MNEHASDILPMLMWMIVVVGGALLGLLTWIGNRLHTKVEELPAQVSVQVEKVHAEIVSKMAEMNATHARLERDLREQHSKLDRRVTVLEVSHELHHGRLKE